MRKKEMILNEMELEVMKLFWSDPIPKSCMDIHEQLSFRTLGYINKVLNSLLRKEMLFSDTYRKEGNHNIRLFKACCTREDYAAILLSDLNIKPDSLPDIAVALTKEVSVKEFADTETELERTLAEFRQRKCIN